MMGQFDGATVRWCDNGMCDSGMCDSKMRGIKMMHYNDGTAKWWDSKKGGQWRQQ